MGPAPLRWALRAVRKVMSVAELQELEEVKLLVTKGQQTGTLTFTEVATALSEVELDEGEMYVVPKGVRHNPVAEHECLIMLIERKSTLHSGNAVNANTRSLAEQLRPLDKPQNGKE